MSDNKQRQANDQARASISHELQVRFAPEDAILRDLLTNAQAENIPAHQISPLQGKLLQVLALTCGARAILEIGTLTGYSGIWLARALPQDGKLISLEVDPRFADFARSAFSAAGVGDRTEVRVGPALDLLPTLIPEAPFDLIFIDADKANNPLYLDWALRLSRPGSLIIADNIVRGGRAFQTPPPDASAAGVATYIHKILEHPRLVSAALPHDDDINGIDGFAISVVRN